MAEKPEGRRTTRTWTDRAALAAPWASLVIVICKVIEDWVLPHVL
ncbi:hypothetical protein [Streptomyces sp. G45]